MNTDIRLKVGFLDNPKVVKLRRRYGPDAVLALIRFWFYVAENKPTGDLSNVDKEDIDIACGECGVSMHDVMLELGFIHQTKNGYKVHDWAENQSWVAKAPERKKKAKAAADKRWNDEKKRRVKSHAPSMLSVYDEHAQGNAPFLSFPFLTLPKHLAQSKDFALAWVKWETHRRERKQKLTQLSVEQQIKKLSAMTLSTAIATIEHSIACGYQGLFPPKNMPQVSNGPRGVVL